MFSLTVYINNSAHFHCLPFFYVDLFVGKSKKKSSFFSLSVWMEKQNKKCIETIEKNSNLISKSSIAYGNIQTIISFFLILLTFFYNFTVLCSLVCYSPLCNIFYVFMSIISQNITIHLFKFAHYMPIYMHIPKLISLGSYFLFDFSHSFRLPIT